MTKDEILLTRISKWGGCAAKIPAPLLFESLKNIKSTVNEKILVGLDTSDDAGIFQISEDLALVQTVDFITPVVNDPFIYGQIAAANALSDIYAMGGRPITSLNIVGFCSEIKFEILAEILAGGEKKLEEAECSLVGGHSVNISEMIYGMSITGTVHPGKIQSNSGARPGDILILTKALGNGVLNTTLKHGQLPSDIYPTLINSMLRLNKSAAQMMQKYRTHACTDISGFGLVGHGMEMAKASGVILKIDSSSLPILPYALESLKRKILTSADCSNRKYTENLFHLLHEDIDPLVEKILFDPQTSGGLLISVAEADGEKLLQDLINHGDEAAAIIGMVEEPNVSFPDGSIVVI